jgi:hypothetical protein
MPSFTIDYVLSRISGIVNLAVPILGSLAFVVFLWGIVKYIYSAGDENKKTEAKNYIIYGLIGMFILVALWGILGIVLNTFFGGTTFTPIKLPAAPTQ